MICEFLREHWDNSLGECWASVREFGLLEFQQRVWEKIPPEDEEGLSQNKEAIKKRNYRARLKQKKDYENLLKELKENAKKKE